MEELFSGIEDATGKTNTYVKENWNIKKKILTESIQEIWDTVKDLIKE